MRLFSLLLFFFAVIPAHAQDRSAVLLLDDSVSTVSGARWRVGFERFPVGNEKPAWENPSGRLGATGVALLAGGGLIGAGMGDAYAQAQRNESIQLLRTTVEQDKRLYGSIVDATRASSSDHGYAISETFLAQGVAAGHVARAVKGNGEALMVKRDSGPLVALSWDDRQPLLALDFRRFKRSEGGRIVVREQAARTVRYVGYPAPSTAGAVEYWAADGAKRFMAEVEAGLTAMLPLAWSTDIDMPSVSRKERVALQIGEQQLEFPGRLWKQDGALAYLYNSDKGITLVRTQPLIDSTGSGGL